MIFAKVTSPNSGYSNDKEAVAKLDSSVYYAVEWIEIGGSSTRFTLIGNRETFNSVNFTFYELVCDEYVEYDIFSDPDLNPYL